MLQLLYVSTAAPAQGRIDPDAILGVSRRNNARDSISGALYFDGERFLQVLEGSDTAIEATFSRIRTDRRHNAIVVLSRRAIEARDFGAWGMAHFMPGEDHEGFVDRVSALVATASPNLRTTFESFARHRKQC